MTVTDSLAFLSQNILAESWETESILRTVLPFTTFSCHEDLHVVIPCTCTETTTTTSATDASTAAPATTQIPQRKFVAGVALTPSY